MDQRDLADWLSAIMDVGVTGQAYNVGSDVPVTMFELAHLVRDILAKSKPVRMLGVKQADNGRNRYIPTIAKAQTELGLRLHHDLHSSISDAAHYAIL